MNFLILNDLPVPGAPKNRRLIPNFPSSSLAVGSNESFGITSGISSSLFLQRSFLLNDPAEEEAELKLPSFPARNYAEAKSVVKYALTTIESAKKFFTLNERASDYVDCTFDHSSIFGAIVPFEPEIDNRCKMIKRRIDMLEALSNELNPQYFLQHCRKIHYELGDIYSQQVSLKYAQHESTFAKVAQY